MMGPLNQLLRIVLGVCLLNLLSPASAAVSTDAKQQAVSTPAASVPVNPPPVAGPSSAAMSTADAEKQLALLKQQVEITRGFQSDMLSTVYAALTGIFTAVFAIIGINVFSAVFLNARERRALRRELTNTITEQFARAEQSLRDDVLAERVKTTSEIQSLRAEFTEKRVDDQTQQGLLALGTAVAIDATSADLKAVVENLQKAWQHILDWLGRKPHWGDEDVNRTWQVMFNQLTMSEGGLGLYVGEKYGFHNWRATVDAAPPAAPRAEVGDDYIRHELSLVEGKHIVAERLIRNLENTLKQRRELALQSIFATSKILKAV